MKIIFFGNADFGLETLEALIHSSQHELLAIVTNPDKRINRNKKNKINPIKQAGLSNEIPVIEQENISDEDFLVKLKGFKADVFLVIAYKIIPESVYNIPKYKAINLHASILPKYRGASPIQRALMNGDKKTGLSTFFINDKIDRGKLIYQEEVSIKDTDSFYDLWLRLAQKGPNAVFNTLDLIGREESQILSYKENQASYAPKINKKELSISWHESSLAIHNKIRALSPYLCMHTSYNKLKIKVVASNLVDRTDFKSNGPGSIFIFEHRLFVECSDKFLEILKLKPESKAIMSAQDFINGFIKKTNSKTTNAFR